MTDTDSLIQVDFCFSGKQAQVSLDQLTRTLTQFLGVFGNEQFCGPSFADLLGQGNAQARLANLLAATGCANDPEKFFKTVLSRIGQGQGHALTLNGVRLPSMLLVALLEAVIPGHGYVSVKTTDQLARTANLEVPDSQAADLQAVIDKYPVRVSRHTVRQMMVARDVAYQYLPFVEELDAVGHTNTWIGQFHDGLLEQMYQNRVIFLLNMSCPVYCRFCFRKHKDSRNESNPTPADVARAVQHVKDSPRIKEIVVTGGDPFMNRDNMAATIDGLMDAPHVETLRLATRSIAYYPDLFLEKEGAYLKYLKQKSLELQQHGKRMEVATHFIHPDEVSPESLEIISDLVKNGIAVYIQTPFLSACNDQGPELVRLFNLLRGAGADMHYIYIPCSPIHGNSIYWKPLSDGIDMALHLRAHLSDRAIPRICTATPIGKMDWYTSGWAVEKVADNENFIWIRTPYTPGYFKAFAPLANELTNIRVNAEGTIDIQYMARMGDETRFIGHRPQRASAPNPAATAGEKARLAPILADQCQPCAMVNTGLPDLDRLHETRVRIRPDAGKAVLAYIEKDHRITDVVVAGEVTDNLDQVRDLLAAFQAIPHVNSLRLVSGALILEPERYNRTVIHFLGDLNRLAVVSPLRMEIETWAMTADQVLPEHKSLVRRLNNRGITVYVNVPVLGGVNDNAQAIHDLAFALRSTGMEFHHLYAAGLPLQTEWNSKFPVDAYDITDMATMVRREGSGREIPRYIIATDLGEVDYGLTSTLIRSGDKVKIKLGCYDLAYYKSMDKDFEFPGQAGVGEDGSPVLPLPGLLKTNDFPVS